MIYRIVEIDGLGTIKVSVERGNIKAAKKMAVMSGNSLNIMQINKDYLPL